MALSKKPAKKLGAAKSRKNTSGRKSEAKKQAEARTKKAKDLYKKGSKKKVATKSNKTKKKKIQTGLPWKPKPLNAHAPFMLPETMLTRKGMTLRKLMQNTPKLFANNGKYVDIIGINKTLTRSKMPAIVATMLTRDPNQPGHTKIPRKVYVIGLDKDKEGKPDSNKPINRHRRVMVQCPCEGYIFYGAEYSNALHGAARIIYGNGEPPLMSNPAMIPHLCIAEGQRVMTTKGLINIEDISICDMVITEQGPCKVLDFGYTGTKPVLEIVFGKYHSLKCTANHPIRVLNTHTEEREWKNAGFLKPGDTILGISGYYDSDKDIAITKNEVQAIKKAGKAKVYDLTVEKAGHFVVNGISVSNCKHIYSLATHLIKKDI
jgi:hypothetical protein